MYVMDKYFVKQPQNIIIKVKMKEHKIGKKDYIYTGKKLNEIYIIAFIFLWLWDSHLFSFIYIRKSCSVNLVWI